MIYGWQGPSQRRKHILHIYKLAAGVPIGAFSGSLSRVLVLESKYIYIITPNGALKTITSSDQDHDMIPSVIHASGMGHMFCDEP